MTTSLSKPPPLGRHVMTPTASEPSTARRFRPRLWPTLAAALLIPLFIAAGQWQWTKAAAKTARQQQLDARSAEPAIAMPGTPVDAQALRDRKVIARGRYEPEQQILIDNRVHDQQAGYHVVTPLHLEGSETRLLVNRGWVKAPAEHRLLPQVETPRGIVEVQGTAVLPASRFFSLGAEGTNSEWQGVWQHLDLARYGRSVGFPIQPVVVELDARSEAGGFVRDWRRPDQRIQTNLGYALQWWAFAATTAVLWLFFSVRRTT
ncbi:MAG: surfeit locus 1 [Proteobacteria bacterium]|nr:surfeit locus 1 [Pseudomonadota bacterium]